MFEILIDTGGTFTDGVLIGDGGTVSVAKSETNPGNPAKGIMNCIAGLAEEQNTTTEDLLANTSTVMIGTTLPTNCILEEKGARCGLVYTKGFRDVYELGRTIPKTDIYNLKVLAPKVLIPRYLRFGVEERIQYDGSVATPLNEADVLEAVKKLKEHDVEVPVICFLHSYINPEHEEKAAEIIKSEYPNVVVSSQIVRRWIEYDRLSTAVFAGYVKPLLTRFVSAMEEELTGARFKGTLLFSTGLGNVATSDLCLENPGHLIGSGLATGALMGRYLAEAKGFQDVVTYDMGGTSVDIGVLKDRNISTSPEAIIGDQKNAIETMDIPSIGAGGGAIGWIDKLGVLRIGPSSAGAEPGPACYGKGGTEPTLTDANVLLGYIPTDFFLGGSIQLNQDLAKKAVDEKISGPLGIETIQAAYSMSSLAETITAERIFLTIVEKGYDPGDFVLIVGGGAGPVHAIALAKKLGMKGVYIPKHASVFSAFGGAVADYGHVMNSFFYQRDDIADIKEATKVYTALEKEAFDVLKRQGVEDKNITLGRGAEMRYFGQLRDIIVTLPETRPGDDFTEDTFGQLVQSFHDRHQELYGWSDPKLPATVAILKVRGIGKRNPFVLEKQPLSGQDPSGAFKRNRQVYFKALEGFVETPCYDGELLKPGNVIKAPAIIEEKKTTVVVPPGSQIEVDAYDNYLATLNTDAS